MENSKLNSFTIPLWVFLVIMALMLIIGYFIGRGNERVIEGERVVEVKWIKGDEIRDTIQKPVPYKVTVIDSVFIPVDTAALFAVWLDWNMKRNYDLDFSNDSLGVFKIDVEISKNSLISATSTLQPNIRMVNEKEIVYKVPKVQPWVMIGTSVNLRTNKLQAGIDIKNRYIIGASGLRMDDKWGYTIDFGIKF